MNFSVLNYFLVVAEELNITKASARLYISQQSLSSQIIKLEKELGAQLFNRTPVFSLTYAGNRLVKAATQMLNVRRTVLNEIDDITKNRRGELKIGISHTRGRALLPDILPKYHEARPLVELSLIEANSETLEQKLQHGMIDLAISFAPFMLSNVETIELCEDKLTLVVPDKFMTGLYGKNADNMRDNYKRKLDFRAFENCPFLMLKEGNRLRSIINDYFMIKNITPNVILETENIETAFRLALEGMGLVVYPEMYIKKLASFNGAAENPSVNVFPIRDITGGKIAIGYSRNHYLSVAARDFIDIIVHYFKDEYL